MDQDESATTPDASPLGAATHEMTEAVTLAEGPVRFLLVSGPLDDTQWGLVGAYWMSIDGERGGFILSPGAAWIGSEISRGYASARRRGWSHQAIYTFWQERMGFSGRVMVDPQQHADTLFQVARRIGAL